MNVVFFCRSDSNGGPGGSEGGPKTPQQMAAQRRLQQTQAQVDEVYKTFIVYYPTLIVLCTCL